LVGQRNHTSGDAALTVTLTLTNADESVTYGSGTISIGSGLTTGDTPDNLLSGTIEISGVPADTTIFGKFIDGIGARLVSATVHEVSLPVSASNGYVVPPQVAATAPIYDARRKTMYELATKLWKRGAAHLWNWTVDDQSTP